MDKSSIAKYYHVLKGYNNFRTVKSRSVCSLCFQSSCDHDLPTIKRKEALEAYLYWTDVALMGAKNSMIHVDDDIVIPEFPLWGEYDNTVKYDVVPRLNLPISVIHVGEKVSVFTGREPSYVDLPRLKTKGIHYGYIVFEQFYLLKSFRNGSFFTTKVSFNSPNDLQDNEFVAGFLRIPRGTLSYDDFARNIHTS